MMHMLHCPSLQHRPSAVQRGLVLVSSLLLLLVVTILAVSMFRSFGLQEKIAGNLREKERALHAAQTAQQYAEQWLLGSGNATTGINCTTLLDANSGQGQVCSNILAAANVANVPWKSGTADVGVTYKPFDSSLLSTSGGAGTYYAAPRFYISYLSLAPGGQGSIYQIDAMSYGGSANAVAVVESTFMVSTGVKDLGGL